MSDAPILDVAALGRPRRDTGALMRAVMLALVPGTLVQLALLGADVLVNLAVVLAAALAFEALALLARGRPLAPALADGSVVLTAWLLALALPPALPPWQGVVGAAAAVLLGKQLYGGLGRNPFNPAMVGYAVLIVSFPLTMTAWPEAAAGPPLAALETPLADDDAAAAAARDGGLPPRGGAEGWDAFSAATPLDRLRALERIADAADAPAGALPSAAVAGALVLGSPWPWINAGFLAGGLWMLARGVIGWRIPVSFLAAFVLADATHAALAGTPEPPTHVELLAGSAMLGAFFIATDPVSAASSPRGRLLYGGGIGVLVVTLREWSAYPDGIAFAVLLMNGAVPLIDHLSVARAPPR